MKTYRAGFVSTLTVSRYGTGPGLKKLRIFRGLDILLFLHSINVFFISDKFPIFCKFLSLILEEPPLAGIIAIVLS